MSFRRVVIFGLLILGSISGFVALALLIADESINMIRVFVGLSTAATFSGLVTAISEFPIYKIPNR